MANLVTQKRSPTGLEERPPGEAVLRKTPASSDATKTCQPAYYSRTLLSGVLPLGALGRSNLLDRSGIVTGSIRVMLGAPQGEAAMGIGITATHSIRLQHVALLRLLFVVVVGFGWVLPAPAHALTAIPMCSAFGECTEAPPPEAPPTGGELRARPLRLFDTQPACDQGSSEDRSPPTWGPTPIEPVAAIPLAAGVCFLPGDHQVFSVYTQVILACGFAGEIFRPPCAVSGAAES